MCWPCRPGGGAAGDVNALLLDKTAPLRWGNRMATDFIPAPGIDRAQFADAAQLASMADETPEGRSIVVLAKKEYNLRERDLEAIGAEFVHFSAQTRMSGVNLKGREIRKGAMDAIQKYVTGQGGVFPRKHGKYAKQSPREAALRSSWRKVQWSWGPFA
jgi:K+-transporting ATPase ATPase B chain